MSPPADKRGEDTPDDKTAQAGEKCKMSPPADKQGEDTPDDKTAQAGIFTEGKARGQVFHCCFGKWFKYGTDDKVHAGAIILSFILVSVIAVLSLLSSFPQLKTDIDVLKMLGNALLLTIGAAIGRSTIS